MVCQEEIQNYARKLKQRGVFLNLVLSYIRVEIYKEIVACQKPKPEDNFYQIITFNISPLDKSVAERLAIQLKEYLDEPDFWELSAESILKKA